MREYSTPRSRSFSPAVCRPLRASSLRALCSLCSAEGQRASGAAICRVKHVTFDVLRDFKQWRMPRTSARTRNCFTGGDFPTVGVLSIPSEDESVSIRTKHTLAPFTRRRDEVESRGEVSRLVTSFRWRFKRGDVYWTPGRSQRSNLQPPDVRILGEEE